MGGPKPAPEFSKLDGFLTVQQAVAQGAHMLSEAGIDAARLTAEVLLMHAIGCDRSWLFAHSTDPLKELWWIHYGRYLHQRLSGVPTQHITGVQEFYGRDFRVTHHVLIPRPETEHLIEAALEKAATLGSLENLRILDIGTGSGCIAATLALELNQRVLASDISHQALRIAKKNSLALNAPVDFFEADLTASIAPASIDLIVSNPPYIATDDRATLQREVIDHEPELALFGGADGLIVYRRLIPEAARILKPGGWLILEIGGEVERDQASAVSAMLSAEESAPSSNTWTNVETRTDLANLPRVVIAQRR